MQQFQHACLAAIASICLPLSAATAADAIKPAPRNIVVDAAQASKSLDRFYHLSVGADYPGALIRDDSMAQLRRSGFRANDA